jgi:hypothetical protein
MSLKHNQFNFLNLKYMNTKTPKFSELMEKYFSELELDEQGGQERVCRVSGKKFYITAEDIEFYKKMQVPLPTLSPNERTRKKLGFFNIYNLFFNKSAKTGKKIVSIYPKNTPYKIWEYQLWNSDEFNPFNYGVDYDYEKSFFKQYKKFQLQVPRTNLNIINAINSNFTNYVNNVKNCYLVTDAKDAEDCQHSTYAVGSKNCHFSYGATKSDACYECNMVQNSYKCFFVEFSNDCIESSFLFDCRNCQNCFMSSNLRHQNYVFYNQQLSKSEYQEKMKGINFGNREEIEKLQQDFFKLKKKAIHRANNNEKNINCTGDYLKNSKNCHSCFFVFESENMAYCVGNLKHKDSYDMVGGVGSELSYETMSVNAGSYQTKFSTTVTDLRNSEYCDYCKNCFDCFACIGLKNKKFCIFNKQYSEEEYWQKLDEIKTKMLKDGEYGEFFPKELAPISYNISVATSYGGYDDLEIAKKYGYKIEEVEEPNPDTQNEINIDEIPDDIKDVTDDILTKVIIDEKNNKKFKYTKEELEFHRKYNLALPTEHYSAILARKRIALGPIDFNPKYRNCAKCNEKTQVTFPENHPDAPLKVYCEKCYNEVLN